MLIGRFSSCCFACPIERSRSAALTAELFGGHVVYDPAIDRLRSANKAEPLPLGVRPPPLDPVTLPTYTAGPPPGAVDFYRFDG